jgi:cyclohexyl-isocyanide hydratase
VRQTEIIQIGFLAFPDLTALDLVGPHEVLSRVPGVECRIVAERAGPFPTQKGIWMAADVSYDDCPQLDLLCVPGGPGQEACMEDARLLQFLRTQAEGARWMAGICTGSLILGAAGLLRGYRATTHWRYRECLRDLGAAPVQKRVVSDRSRITAAGVSAGIDMGLFIAALLAGDHTAQSIQLQLEYDPHPPFRAGTPEQIDEVLLEQLEEQTQAAFERRREQARRVGALLGE